MDILFYLEHDHSSYSERFERKHNWYVQHFISVEILKLCWAYGIKNTYLLHIHMYYKDLKSNIGKCMASICVSCVGMTCLFSCSILNNKRRVMDNWTRMPNYYLRVYFKFGDYGVYSLSKRLQIKTRGQYCLVLLYFV